MPAASTFPRAPIAIASLLVGLGSSAAYGAVKTWDGGAGTQLWSDAANWSPDGVPGAGDDAVIDVAGSITVTINAPVSVSSLTCAETLVLNSNLTIGQPSTISGTLTWNSGSIAGTAKLTIAPGGTATLGSGGNKVLDRMTLQIGGSGSWDGSGVFTLTNSGTATGSFLEILAGGSFTLPPISQSYNVSPGCGVNNAGTLTKPGGGTFNHVVPLNNTGLVVVDGGSLDLVAGGANDGTYQVLSGQCRFLSNQTHGATAVLSGNNRFSGGTQTLVPGATINNLTIDGATVANAVPVTIGGTVTWLGGVLTGNEALRIDGATTMTNAGNKVLDRKTLEIGGAAAWDGSGTFTLTNSGSATGSFLEILAGGSFTLPPISQSYNVSPGCGVNNAGTLTKPGGGTFTHVVPLNNTGLVVVEGGLLDIVAGGTNDGTVEASGGAARYSSSTLHTANADLSGDIRFTGGTQTLEPGVAISSLLIEGATVVNAVPVTLVDCDITWNTGTLFGAPLTLDAGSTITLGNAGNKALDRKTLRIGGSGSWSGGGTFTLTDSGTSTKSFLEILAGGSFTLPAVNQTFSSTAGCGVNNYGLLTKPGAGTFSQNIALNNIDTGNVVVEGGSLDLTGGGTNDGLVNVTGGQCRFLSSFNHTSHSFLLGNTRFTGGTQTLSPGALAQSLTIEGGIVTNSDVVTLTGALTWTGGTLTGAGALRIDGAVSLTGGGNKALDRKTLQIGGSGSWDGSGTFTLSNSGSATGSFLEILAGGSFTLPSISQTFNVSPGCGVNNAGTLTKPGGGTFTHVVPLNNTGLVVVDGGSLDLVAGGANDGTYQVLSGQCRFLSNQTHGATAVLSGNNRFSGGTQTLVPGATINNLTIDGATVANAVPVTIGGTVTWLGGVLTGNGALRIDGATTMTGAGNKVLDRKTLEIGGAAAWDGSGTFTLTNSGSATGSFLEILAGGSFTLPPISQSYNVSPGCGVNNAGTLTKPGPGTFTHTVPLNNTGTVSVDAGTLSMAAGYTQTAGATILNGGTITNVSALALQGGLLKGNGTSGGLMAQTGGTISPGFSPGLITVGSSLTQNASSVLDIEIGGPIPGSQHDQLIVSGSATLAGTLRLTFTDGYVPHHGDTFTVVSAGSRSGTFGTVDVTNFPDCVAVVNYTSNAAIVQIETTPPVALCHDLDVNLSAAGAASITAAQIDAGSFDNCQLQSLTVAPNTFTCSQLGTNIVTLTATDLVGNVATCQAIVNVHDVTAPVIAQMPPNLNLQCPSLVPGPNTAEVVATDACGPITVTWQGDASNGGAGCPASPLVVTRTYRATDGSGNHSELAQTITVVDSTAPAIVAFPRDEALQCLAELPPADVGLVSATENCGGVPTITHVGDTNNGGAGCPESPLVISRTYRATDTCGNTAEQVQTFTIVNDVPPIITAFPSDAVYQCAAEIPASDVALVAATGHCGGTVGITVADDTDNGGSGCAESPLVVTRTYTATDSCGNMTSRSQTFTVVDTTAPVFAEFPIDLALQCASEVPAPEDQRVAATDNCNGVVTITHQGDVDNGGTGCGASPLVIARTYRAADACGNVIDAIQVITVLDDSPPTILSCPADASIEQGCDTTLLPDLAATLVVGGECGPTSIEQSPPAGTRLEVGKHLVTFTVHDACGNVATCQSTYTVTAAACPGDLTHDATVAADDLAILLGAWGPCAGCCADLDRSGEVNAVDLAILLGAWGQCPSGAPDASDGSPAGAPTSVDTPTVAAAASQGAGKPAGDRTAGGNADGSDPGTDAAAPAAEDRLLVVDPADGIIVIDGDLVLAPSDRVVLFVRSGEPITGCDLIVVEGTATLDGTLELVFGDASGDRFDQQPLDLPIIVAKRISGRFASVVTDLDPLHLVEVDYAAEAVSIVLDGADAAAPAGEAPTGQDVNGDGVVDVADLIAVLGGECPDCDALAIIRSLVATRARPG